MERVCPILKKYSEKALNRTLKCSSDVFNTPDQEKIQRKGYKSVNYLVHLIIPANMYSDSGV